MSLKNNIKVIFYYAFQVNLSNYFSEVLSKSSLKLKYIDALITYTKLFSEILGISKNDLILLENSPFLSE